MNENETVEHVRGALVEVAMRAYEDAGVQGLCAEGRWEAAVSAMRSLDLTRILARTSESASTSPR